MFARRGLLSFYITYRLRFYTKIVLKLSRSNPNVGTSHFEAFDVAGNTSTHIPRRCWICQGPVRSYEMYVPFLFRCSYWRTLKLYAVHAFLWSRAIEYGDPNLSNVRYDQDLKYGVLIDYGLSISWRQPGIDTEGIPFRAIDLLTDEYWDGKIVRP